MANSVQAAARPLTSCSHTQTQTLEEQQVLFNLLQAEFPNNIAPTLIQDSNVIQWHDLKLFDSLRKQKHMVFLLNYINVLQSGTLTDLTIYCGKWKYCYACWLRWSACSAKTRRAMQELSQD